MIHLKFINWDDYNKRSKHYKNAVWFSFSNDFATNRNFFNFTNNERLTFVYLLCEASKDNDAGVFLIEEDHFCSMARITKKELTSTIVKLMDKQILAYAGQSTVLSGQQTVPTEQDRTGQTGQDSTEQDKGSRSIETSSLPRLAELWNEHTKLSKIKGCSAKRKKSANERWKENPSEEYWIETIKRVNESDFCNGKNDRSWKADFDFFIKPDTHHKVNEGKYSNRKSGNAPRHQRDEDLDSELKLLQGV